MGGKRVGTGSDNENETLDSPIRISGRVSRDESDQPVRDLCSNSFRLVRFMFT